MFHINSKIKKYQNSKWQHGRKVNKKNTGNKVCKGKGSIIPPICIYHNITYFLCFQSKVVNC